MQNFIVKNIRIIKLFGAAFSLMALIAIVGPIRVLADVGDTGDYSSSYSSGAYGSSYDSGNYGSSYTSPSYGSSYDSGNYGSSYNTAGYGSSYDSGNYGSSYNTLGAYGSSYDSGNYGSSYTSGNYGSSYDTTGYGSSYNSGNYSSSYNPVSYGSSYTSGNYGSSYDTSGYGSSYDSGNYGSSYTSPSYGSSYDSGNYGSSYNTAGYGSSYDSGGYSSTYSSPSYYTDKVFTPALAYSDTSGCGSYGCSGGTYAYSSPSYYSPSYSSGCGSYGCLSPSYPNYSSNCVGVNCNINTNHNIINNQVVTTYSNLSASCYASPNSATIGQSVQWIANASGGNGNYTYSWSGDASGSGVNVNKTYNTSGTKTATLVVHSSDGQSLTRSCSMNVTQVVPQNLNVSCVANPSSVNQNQSVTFTSTATGGNGNYTYSWSGPATGSGNALTTTFGNSGTQTETVTVTSGNLTGTAQCSVSVNNVINSGFDGSCYASQNNNNSVTWYANAFGGNGNYTYSWSGDASGLGQSVYNSYGSYSGTKTANVTIYSNGQSITRSCSTNLGNIYNNNLDATCSVYPSNPQVGQNVSWSVSPIGGSGNYSYFWSGDVSGWGQSMVASYSYAGTKTANVTVYSNGQSITKTCQLNVGGVNGNITVLQNSNGNLASGVFLSQIPYTGIAGNWKISLFILTIGLWSAFVAYIFLKKYSAKKGKTPSEMISEFKRQNLARKIGR